MQYAIVVYETKDQMDCRTNPEKAEAYWGAYFAYSQALEKAGVARGGEGLQTPDQATTVSIRNGKRHVQDGPVIDTKERLGGFFVIEAASLDEALEWASKCPAVNGGSVEVRPTLPRPPGA